MKLPLFNLSRPTILGSLWLVIPLSLSPFHYAHAYIDPGSGSYMIQMVIGVLFGATYVVKGAIARAFRWIKRQVIRPKTEE